MHGMLFSLCFSLWSDLSCTKKTKRANRSAQLMTDNLRVFYCSLAYFSAQIARREREK
jgi:hypothetical protein